MDYDFYQSTVKNNLIMPIVLDYVNELIKITSPTTEVDGQTLHDFVQDAGAAPEGSLHPWIDQADPQADTEILYPDGKIEDPGNPGVFSQIILRLNARWQIQFWGGSGYTRIFGAKFVGGVGGQPMLASGTAGDITVMESPVDGVTVVSGSGVTAGDVTDIAEAVWEEAVVDHLTAGSFGELLQAVESMTIGKVTRVGDIFTVYKRDDITVFRTYDLSDRERNPVP